jgi:putative permease
MQAIRDWVSRHFNDPQVVGLAALLLVGFLIIAVLGDVLAPVLASIVLAYLLEAPVTKLERLGMSRVWAVSLVFLLFLAALVLILFLLLPMLSRQGAQLLDALPGIIRKGRAALEQLVHEYPFLVPAPDAAEADLDQAGERLRAVSMLIETELRALGGAALQLFSLESVVTLITLLVYALLVPFMVFFFLKDKASILAWMSRFLPREQRLAAAVWHDVDRQMGNYVRGKFAEIVIVWLVTFLTFAAFKLQFSMLLAVMVGLSVIIPYVGATIVTLPVAVIAYFQFGPSSQFAWIVIAYLIIQVLDGNVLVPLLFSEAVNLHPVAIIVAILVFGGIWGFWGIFFAIPLATLIQAVIKAWPATPPNRLAPEGSEPR